MTVPLYAIQWPLPLSPSEQDDFVFEGLGWILEAGETIAAYALTLGADAIAAGLTVGTGAFSPSQPSPTSIKFWFSIAAAHIADAAFAAPGVIVSMTLSITTNNSPSRTRFRTLALQICQE